MLRSPKRTAYRKSFKGGKFKGVEAPTIGEDSALKKGEYGLMATELARLSARQREAGRKMRRHTRMRQGKVWMMVYPDVPVSSKPREVRMGGGKGSVEFWACHVRPGKVRFEVSGVNEARARHALTKRAAKLPMHSRVVSRPWSNV